MGHFTQQIRHLVTSKYFVVSAMVIAYQYSINAAIIVTLVLLILLATNYHYIEPFNTTLDHDDIHDNIHDDIHDSIHDKALYLPTAHSNSVSNQDTPLDLPDQDDIMTSTMEQSIVDKMWFPESNDIHHIHQVHDTFP